MGVILLLEMIMLLTGFARGRGWRRPRWSVCTKRWGGATYFSTRTSAIIQCMSGYSSLEDLRRTCEADRDGLLLDLGHVGVAQDIRDGSVRVPRQIQVLKLADGDLRSGSNAYCANDHQTGCALEHRSSSKNSNSPGSGWKWCTGLSGAERKHKFVHRTPLHHPFGTY